MATAVKTIICPSAPRDRIAYVPLVKGGLCPACFRPVSEHRMADSPIKDRR